MPGFLERERIIAPPGWSRWLVPPAALSMLRGVAADKPHPRAVRLMLVRVFE
jgi:hypothetical protein